MLAFQYDDILCKEMNEEDQSASVNTSKNDFLTTDEEEKSLLLPEAAQTGLSWQLAILFDCHTSDTSATQVRHECYMNDTSATRVVHERHECDTSEKF